MPDKPAKNKNSYFPFDASLDQGTRKFQGKVVRLAPTAALIEVGLQIIKAGDTWNIQMTLPITNESLVLKGKILKTYRRIQQNTGVVDRMGEFYFVGITDAQKNHINSFLVKTGSGVKI